MDREITITVSDDEARRIEERVSSGEFESLEHYIHAALDGFAHVEGADPEWLPARDALRALIQRSMDDPRPALSQDEADRFLDDLIDRSAH